MLGSKVPFGMLYICCLLPNGVTMELVFLVLHDFEMTAAFLIKKIKFLVEGRLRVLEQTLC